MDTTSRQQVLGVPATSPRAAGRAAAAVAGITALLVLLLYLPAFLDGFSRPDAWAWSELHINYAGGFVRRGLLGAIAFGLQARTGLATYVFFGTTFLLLTLLELALLFALLRPLRTRPLLLFLLALSPGLVLFPAYDPGAYLRKDLFLCVGFLGHALLVQHVRQGRLGVEGYRRALWGVIAPYLVLATLVHEVQMIFLGAHALLVALAMRGQWRAVARSAGALLPALGVGLLSLAHNGNAAMAARICASWTGRAALYCGDWSGIDAIGWPLSRTVELSRKLVTWPPTLATWLLAAALTLVPLLLLHAVLRRESTWPLPRGVRPAVLLLQVLPLFAIGWDWGRWLHLLAMASLAVLLADAPRALPAARPSPLWLKGVLAACAAAYVGTWHLPHSGAPTTLAGGLAKQAPRTLASFR